MTDRIPSLTDVPKAEEPVAEVAEIRPRRPRARKLDQDVQDVLKAVAAELGRQDSLWGQQEHPLQGGLFPSGSLAYYRKEATRWKAVYDQRVSDRVVGWDSILLEEVFEALSEEDTDAAIEELIQVAAVAVQAVLSLRRNDSGGQAVAA